MLYPTLTSFRVSRCKPHLTSKNTLDTQHLVNDLYQAMLLVFTPLTVQNACSTRGSSLHASGPVLAHRRVILWHLVLYYSA